MPRMRLRNPRRTRAPQRMEADVGLDKQMKRDMDLIRSLLLQVEGEDNPDLSKWTEEQQLYHMALLIEAEFVHGSIIDDEQGNTRTTITTRLTWSGHEFLDAARNETVWKKAKEKLAVVGTNVAWPILSAVLADLAKKQLGIP